jgi:hypothetical protein
VGAPKDPLKEVREGVDQWIKITCYLMFAYVAVDMMQYLPIYIVDRIIEAVLKKVGL